MIFILTMSIKNRSFTFYLIFSRQIGVISASFKKKFTLLAYKLENLDAKSANDDNFEMHEMMYIAKSR